LLDIHKSSPLKNILFMIKSISPSWHNAETDMKTDMKYGSERTGSISLGHGYVTNAVHHMETDEYKPPIELALVFCEKLGIPEPEVTNKMMVDPLHL